MSLILDALRKSDHQRQRKASDRLHAGPGPARAAGGNNILWLVAFVASAIAAVLVVLVLRLADGIEAVGADAEPHEIVSVQTGQAERPVIRDLASERASRSPPVPAVSEPEVRAVPESNADLLDAPPLTAMPDAFRASLPSLHVDVHAWAENAEERFVLINLKRYAEGDRLEAGPQLRQIQPQGVVLEYQGQLFSLPRR